jgi:cell division protein FtsQ
MKKVLQILMWLIPALGLPVILGFAASEQSNVRCTGIKVTIDESDENFFVDETDIKEIIYSKGDSLVGSPVSQINYNNLEQLILKNPSVKDVQVYSTVEGEVKADIIQRRPVVRIYNIIGESFYIDESGSVMPLSAKFASRVPVANGNIRESYGGLTLFNVNKIEADDSLASKTILDDIFAVVNFIEKDEFWKAQIQQIYVNEKNDIELVPMVGNHKIILGDKKDLETKFKKLMILYQKGLSKTGWNQYSVINLKFKNQVICTKKQ